MIADAYHIAVYITSYISKVENVKGAGWKELYKDMDKKTEEALAANPDATNLEKNALIMREMRDLVKEFIGGREMTAQEAALDAFGLSTFKCSRSFVAVGARMPHETTLHIRKRKDIKAAEDEEMSQAFLDEDPNTAETHRYVGDVSATKYVMSMLQRYFVPSVNTQDRRGQSKCEVARRLWTSTR